ncbi:MAG: SUMF1/EgtB/PvdO family nonheme iron enzyme, partial [Myxococcales bacterium]|nr:SUMF1/EgtB/PvdO family nonheme iron enzyme [Myxococcales bacterium]
SAPAPSPPPVGPCGEDMVLVEGDYCPLVRHRCLRHTKEYDREQERRERLRAQGKPLPFSRVSERCLEYEQPAQCLSKTRRRMRFCLDRYEWPGEVGEKPRLLVSWTEAKALCEAKGKRLCTGDEFNFACEGEALLPYSYGFLRDAKRCNIDKPYVAPERQMLREPECLEDARCRDALAAIDQRAPIGSHPDCGSPFGAIDLNGNVNEWVERPGEREPYRSGLKGGWWGPARSRCRPMVTVHDENYVGYEVGFRCCRDLSAHKSGDSQKSSGTSE